MSVALSISDYKECDRKGILALSVRAWASVFAKLEPAVVPYVFNAFYPKGWAIRQSADIESILDNEPQNVLVAIENDAALGWVGIRLHPEDSLGEIYILAVDPAAQRRGIASALMEAAFEKLRKTGMKIVMVETGDDPGHAP
jgi:GNAT superfamily N-acetyltransferase